MSLLFSLQKVDVMFPWGCFADLNSDLRLTLGCNGQTLKPISCGLRHHRRIGPSHGRLTWERPDTAGYLQGTPFPPWSAWMVVGRLPREKIGHEYVYFCFNKDAFKIIFWRERFLEQTIPWILTKCQWQAGEEGSNPHGDWDDVWLEISEKMKTSARCPDLLLPQ